MPASTEHTLTIPKESREIIDCVFGLVDDILEKKGFTKIAAENLPALIVALEGADKVKEEVKTKHKADIASYVMLKALKVIS